MNDTLKVIQQRRSTRKYANTPVTSEEKEAILQAAMRAPTAGNMMLYTIIEVEDQTLKDRLAVTCDNQPFIAKAPYVLLFAADYQRWMDTFNWSGAPDACKEKGLQPRTPQEGDLLLAFQPFGTVVDVKVMRCEETQKNLSYGFVKFADAESAAAAMEALNGKLLCGRPMR